MIIGISGKISTGKDEFAKRWLSRHSDYSIHHFADKMKEFASVLTGLPLEIFYSEEGKNKVLGPEWDYVTVGDEIRSISETKKYCKKNGFAFHEEFVHHMTVRFLLQHLGDNAIRKNLHSDAHVNALMRDYKQEAERNSENPNWLIPDVRYPNELEAIKLLGGVVIRFDRSCTKRLHNLLNNYPTETLLLDAITVASHDSEVSLDDYTDWDYLVNNDGTLEDLDKEILKIEAALFKDVTEQVEA